MSRPIFTPAAEADVQQAFEYFEARNAGLGAEFIERVEEAADRIAANPQQYQPVIADVRRANLRKFRYGLWYRIAPDGTAVIACLSHRQDIALVRRRVIRPVDPT